MKIEKGPLQDLYIITPTVYPDDRGYFFESYNQQFFREKGIYTNFVQDNQSVSSYGVIRGLHFQKVAPQAKLVRCIAGKVLDVVVDLRKNSQTYKQSFTMELSEDNMMMMLVPKGFAHGFITLSEVSVFNYKCDEIYLPNQDGGIRHNDSEFNIDWIVNPSEFILSEKDRALPEWSEIEKFVNF
jgi:dTDP-4-dehydrorhamnose 3,5-epimerase